MVARMSTPRMEAALAGLSRYEGAPCRNCGNTVRYTLNCTCVECHRIKAVSRSRELRRRVSDLLKAGKDSPKRKGK